ncbi:hypothetical protein BCR33DRAFT_745180 [Rhizoclosmatium globosum]|uniref:DUF1279 domain-containing protein n=1 Tax=Rhizoclosmatium globosum TaxID=329046 RepID=A0A1Y2B5G6_9FUNG|nr:hypothetical protein BCR33DRAFT_745180 [Rhizoclosmatium globosum]|eukprot:ORY29727.1 hypothetical protein BCR33DRAFT_745180 [Rhizoclosmatium globosum]
MHHRLLLRLTTQSNNPLLRSVPRLPLQSNWPQLQKLQQQQPHRRLLFSKSTKDDSNPKSFKNLIKQHGPAAVLTYAALAGVSYVCFYIAIVASGIDPLQLMHKLPFQNHSVEASQKTEEVKKDQTVVGAMEDAVMSGIHGMEAAMAKGSENVGDIIGVGVETVDAMFHDEKKVVVGVSGGLVSKEIPSQVLLLQNRISMEQRRWLRSVYMNCLCRFVWD